MAHTKTAEEARAELIGCMGEELGELFHALWQEVAWLHLTWQEYVELFGKKESRIDLLNKSAPRFFRIVQDTVWEATILHVARLTDPPRSAGKKNLTICRLPELINDADSIKVVSRCIEDAISSSKFCRDWRNRRLAHRDLMLALGKPATPLASGSRADMKTALKSIGRALNAVEEHHTLSPTAFAFGASGTGGAVSLLDVLKDGVKAEAERLNRITTGEFTMDDLDAPDL